MTRRPGIATRRRSRLLALLVLLVLIVSCGGWPLSPAALELAAPGGGDVRALVIGIDLYHDDIGRLEGAVADARDLASALAAGGVRDLTLMLDAEATRGAILAQLDGLALRVRPGDLVIVTYAGHGSQERERIVGAEADGRDEFFILSGFAANGPATSERLLDDELFARLRRIADAGARLLVLSDACFGGGMVKAIDRRGGIGRTRGLERVDDPAASGPGRYHIAADADHLPVPRDLPSERQAMAAMPLLTFLSAVDDATLVPEVDLPGIAGKRGAASFVLARAFEGAADRDGNGDGVTTRGELIAFLRRQVVMLTASLQHPVGLPADLEAAALPVFADRGGAPRTTAPTGSTAPVPAAVATPAASVSTGRKLYWDSGSGDVIDSNGVVLAFGVHAARLDRLQARAAAIDGLLQRALGHSLALELVPPEALVRQGDWLTARVSGVYGRHLILLDIAGDGSLQFLYPRNGADPYLTQDEHELKLRIGPPFGVDTLVAIASKQRLTGLELALSLLARDGGIERLPALLDQHLGSEDRIGLASFSTRPRAFSHPIPTGAD